MTDKTDHDPAGGLDEIAGDIAHDVLDACLHELEIAGVDEPHRKALAAAYFAIASTDAIAGEGDSRDLPVAAPG